MQDTELVCSACGGRFLFSASEQAYYAERGFQLPKRCRGCRQARRRTRGGGRTTTGRLPVVRPYTTRETFKGVCPTCGDEVLTPFPGQAEAPLCGACFQAQLPS